MSVEFSGTMCRFSAAKKVRPMIFYHGTKLSTFFSEKDKVQKENSSNIIYHYQSKHDKETAYIGKKKCRFGNRNQGRDKQLAIVIKSNEKNLLPPSPSEFSIIGRNYSNRLKRIIAESLYLKEKTYGLSVQFDANKLKFFN